jgi:phage terminase Nu1 subunit (DNA packaging protein)
MKRRATAVCAVNDRKHEVGRPYPPDYVSAETLAYRLDCSRSTVEAYVRAGLLPKPEFIGNLTRWDFAVVIKFIKARNGASAAGKAGKASELEDAYLKGIRRGETA